ncbi:aminotransferase class III-fold pyridoxal phosphate-dependent enzyme [Saccharomonospora sp. NPDC046836]|uniref:aminotransferase class III-fold pyridoxal phosphate-dependent enzyme n=1 Tax=Saccharomonospora sp. NPDC046836 TaxID=3156921 RepID=UPI0033DF217F
MTVVNVLAQNAFDETARRLGDVRGRGLLQGIELVTDRATKHPANDFGAEVTTACFDLGLHLNIVQFPGASSIFRMAPPLTITDAELDRGLDILDQALTIAARRA